MAKWVFAYLIAAVIFGILDVLWLNNVAVDLYRSTVGEIMADDLRLIPALVFYAIYLFGIIWFAVKPGLTTGRWTDALLNGAFLGFIAYATFDLTSQAVFKVWTWQLSVIDIAWGIFATGVTSALTAWLVLKIVKA